MSRTKEWWDQWFLGLARYVSTASKDSSTQVGCIVVKGDKTVVSSGYNGLPRGADDSIPTRLVRPEKLFWFEHAERNALYSAAKTGNSVDGCTAYSTLCPCMDCARGIIQSGITRVVCPKPDLVKYSLWAPQFLKVEELFKECNVRLDYID
jgi:dCMP deaminase